MTGGGSGAVRVKLTKRVIDAARCPAVGERVRFLRDTEIAGFSLRLTAGSRSFVFERRIHGPVRSLTVGTVGEITVEQARAKVLDMIAAIGRGEDPAEAKRAARVAWTFGQLEEAYRERYLSRLDAGTQVNEEGYLKNYVHEWTGRKVKAITRGDVAALHASIGQAHPFAANGVVKFLRKVFNLAEEWGQFSGVNPAKKITLFPEPSRERFLSAEELERFLGALAKEDDPALKAVFLILLLTGARRGEVLAMEWAHVDLVRGLWRLPTTKAGRAHLLPLPGPVRAAIAAVPRIEGNPFLFVGRWRRGHLAGVRTAWEGLLDRAKLDDVRLHDLRRTLGSWLAIEGASIALIGKVLGHSQLETTAIYARLNIEPQRIALEANAQKMLTAAGASDGKRVVAGSSARGRGVRRSGAQDGRRGK